MLEEHHELIIKLMAEKINQLEALYKMVDRQLEFCKELVHKLDREVESLKPKRGRPVKKRGRGRPKGSRNV